MISFCIPNGFDSKKSTILEISIFIKVLSTLSKIIDVYLLLFTSIASSLYNSKGIRILFDFKSKSVNIVFCEISRKTDSNVPLMLFKESLASYLNFGYSGYIFTKSSPSNFSFTCEKISEEISIEIPNSSKENVSVLY